MGLFDFLVFYCLFVIAMSAILLAWFLIDWLMRMLRGKP